VSISKLIAEADAIGSKKKIRTILSLSFVIVGLTSILLTVAMLLLIPPLAGYLFPDRRVLYPLLAITPVIPIVAVSSVLRGYFQGVRNMKPYAISGIIEQIVRISLVATLTGMLMPFGVQYAAAGAMIAGAAGECLSLLYMIRAFKKERRARAAEAAGKSLRRSRSTLRRLLGIGLPTMGSRLIGSLSSFFEPIIVAHSMVIAGYTARESTPLYGQLTGFALTLLLLPGFITHALHVSLVPAVSEAYAKNDYGLIHLRLNQALRIALLTGGLSIVVTSAFARPLTTLIYDSPESAEFIHLMAPFFLIFYFQAPLHAVLQALDLAKAAMFNTLFGAVVKLITLFLLTSRPEFGIKGAALAICLNVILVTVLHAAVVFKSIGFSLVIGDYVRIAVLIVSSLLLSRLLIDHALTDWSLLPRTAVLIGIVVLFYGLLALWLGMIRGDLIGRLPLIGKWVITNKSRF
jgi:stage V sporulation protein B